MLSRTADHLYWMSRYLERAENIARMLDAHHRLSTAAASAGSGAARLAGDSRLARHGELIPGAARHVTPRAAFDFVAFDREHTGSIVRCLRAARENARAVRGTVTSDMWETLNTTYLSRTPSTRPCPSPAAASSSNG